MNYDDDDDLYENLLCELYIADTIKDEERFLEIVDLYPGIYLDYVDFIAHISN